MGTVATHALNPLILKSTPYDAEKDFAPVSLLVVVPNVLVVNPELPAKTVNELIALLKAEPDKYSYASSGNGTPLHLSGELFKSMAGVSMQHIPYKGAGPALNDVIGNQVPIMFDNLPSSSGHIKAGTLQGAGGDDRRSVRHPSQTCRRSPELGIPGYETYTWNALFAPARHAERGGRYASTPRPTRHSRTRRCRAHEGVQRHDRRLDAGGTRRACEGRARQMGTDRQGREYPDGVI